MIIGQRLLGIEHDNHFIIDSKLLIEDVNNLLGTDLSQRDVDTIGVWFLTQNIDATSDSELEFEGYIIKESSSVQGRAFLFSPFSMRSPD